MELLAGRYELGRTLGSGGMADVLAAHDRSLDRDVAVKLMRTDVTADPAVRERFLREARAAAQFHHPNAVAVYDTGEEGRRPWIVMELVDGITLADRLRATGALDEDGATTITAGVLAALGAAHRRGMVHRDIKPANIMLPHEGGVKLTDFGIAKGVQEAVAGLTATGQLMGTAKYVSPEQVDGQPATPASDVYAMGVVLYEMLAGEPPFDADSPIALALAHRDAPPPPLRRRRRGLDPSLLTVVERALAKDPAQRYPDANAMRRALLNGDAAVAAAAPTAVMAPRVERTAVLPPPAAPSPQAAPPRTATTQKRRSATPVLLGVVALLLLAAIGIAMASTVDRGGDTGEALSEAPADENTEAPGGGTNGDEPIEEPPAEDPDPEAPAEDPPADQPPDEPADDEPADDEPVEDEPADDEPADDTDPEEQTEEPIEEDVPDPQPDPEPDVDPEPDSAQDQPDDTGDTAP